MTKLALPLLLLTSTLGAQEDNQIESVSLFKNGLAVVHMTDEIPKNGPLQLSSLPEPVHGTFWIRSNKPVTAKVTSQLFDTPLSTVSQAELLQNLTGKTVTVHLQNDTITGTILGETVQQKKEWARNYASIGDRPSSRYWHGVTPHHSTAPAPAMTFLRTEKGNVLAIQPGQIQRVEFADLPKIRHERAVLTLESAEPGAVSIDYLTKGLSWAPSYRIDLTDPESLAISQKTIIRNELTDLKNVEFRLISGFPSVRFGSVESPLSPKATWKTFFEQIVASSNPQSNQGDVFLNSMVYQQIGHGGNATNSGGPALGPADEGEGVDLHYHSVGRHSLAPGESLSLQVAEATASYERVVEWNIPDTRSPNGRLLSEHQRRQNRDTDKFDEAAWDAVTFRNPFDFPMTTAPAMLVQNGQFQGQQISTWTNPGNDTCLRITKALSISTRSVENEIPDTRENLRIAGNDHYKVQVQGELTVKNHRGKPSIMVIKRRFSGELLEATDNPTQQLLEVGIYSINKRNELSWRVELKPGEEKVIKYRHEVLVDS